MASVKQKLSSALDFDKTLTATMKIHQVAKIINVKRIVPTFSVNGVFSCQLSPVSDHLTMGYGNGDVEIYNVETGEQVALVQNVCKNLPVTSLRFQRDSPIFYAAGPNGRVRLIDPVLGTNQCVLKVENEISCVDVNADNTYLALVGKEPDVYIYDASTYTVLNVFKGPPTGVALAEDDEGVGHSQRLFVTKFDPIDKHTVLSAGWDSTVKLWDTRTNNVVCSIAGPKVCGEGIDISGHYLLTASWFVKDALQLWDTRTQKLVANLKCRETESTEFLYCAQFYSTDKVLCGGSGITDAKLIDTVDNKVLDELKTNLKVMQCMAVNRTKKLCVAAGLGDNATCATIA